MNSSAKVSIVMPAYNSEEYIKESVYSVIAQTWCNWELLIIDDGSTDNTCLIVEQLSEKDLRIRLFRNSVNRGVAASRNMGILHSAGEWIAFLDSDDCWKPEKLEEQLAFAEDNHAEFTFTGSEFMNEEGERLHHILHVPLQINYRTLLKQNIISCSSVLIRKELIQLYPQDMGDIHEDFVVWLHILKNNKIMAYGLDRPLLIYRVRMTSKSGNKLKAARMTFGVYRYMKLPFLLAGYYWICYVVRSVNKYKQIKSNKSH